MTRDLVIPVVSALIAGGFALGVVLICSRIRERRWRMPNRDTVIDTFVEALSGDGK